MTRGRSLLVHCAAAIVLLALALSPLWNAGLVGEDLALFTAPGGHVHALHPAANASLELTRAVFGTPDARASGAVRALRAENALYLFLGCVLFAAVLRRTLRVWLGDDAGFAAQRAAVVLLPLHPWCLVAVACASARGELLGLFFAGLAAASFLRARQEDRQSWLVLSLVFAAGAGASSAQAWLLPVLLAFLEWLVARRHRSLLARARTTLTTLAGFALVALAPALLAGERWSLPGVDGEALAAGLTGLGRVLVPLHPSSPDLVRAALGGASLLLALQPALVAARSAPRTWGRFALAWGLLILITLAPSPLAAERAGNELASLRWLCLPAICLGAAGASAATAHSGWKRALFPWILALALIALGRPVLDSWREATRRIARLSAELAAAAREGAPEIALVSPPRVEHGLELLTAADPAARLRDAAHLARAPEIVDGEGLARWAKSSSFPADLLALQPAASTEAPLLGDVLPARRRLQRRGSADEPVFWRERARSPVLNLDPQWLRCVRVVLHPGASPEGVPRVFWRSEDHNEPVSAAGAWTSRGESPSAVFDLAGDPQWLFFGRINRVWFEGELAQLATAEIVASVPELELALPPHPDAQGWEARLARVPPSETGLAPLEWRLELFDTRTFASHVLSGRLAAEQALRFEDRRAWSAGRDALEWTLEACRGPLCIARSRGRR